jgi:cytochrome bd-type quinol oxidase subunit 1
MKRDVLIAWVLTAVFVIAAIVALAAKPTHWKRTIAVAVVLAVIAAAVAVVRGRRPADA